MSHINPSDSELEDGDTRGSRHSSNSRINYPPTNVSRDKKGRLSPVPQAASAISDDNLHEACGVTPQKSHATKDKVDGIEKQLRRQENEYNNIEDEGSSTAATAADTSNIEGAQVIIQRQRGELQPNPDIRHPRDQMQQQQEQQQPPTIQGGGGDAGGAPPVRPACCGHCDKDKWKKLWHCVGCASIFVVVLISLIGVVSIIVWATVINKWNTEPQIVYANLFEVIHLEENLHPLTKYGADVKINLTGRVDPSFQESNFYISLHRGSCVSPPNQTFTASGRAENYQISGKYAIVSNHVINLGPSAELNISFILNNSTLMNSVNAIYFKVYFFKSYQDLLTCNNSEDANTAQNCPCYFFVPNPGMPSFSYANGSYADSVVCQGPADQTKEKPFTGQHYFLARFLCQNTEVCGSPSIYDHLFVNFTFSYSTTGVFNPLATKFDGQKCNSLDDTRDNIHEYRCGVGYGSFFGAGRPLCTYLTLATSFNAPEIDSRFRDIFPVTITERRRDDVIFFIAGVMLFAVLLVFVAYCAPSILIAVRNRLARRDYQPLN